MSINSRASLWIFALIVSVMLLCIPASAVNADVTGEKLLNSQDEGVVVNYQVVVSGIPKQASVIEMNTDLIPVSETTLWTVETEGITLVDGDNSVNNQILRLSAEGGLPESVKVSVSGRVPVLTSIEVVDGVVVTTRQTQKTGYIFSREGYTFDAAYTSVLKRAIRTLWIALDEMNLMWIPVTCSWKLNERHYGALQGLNKAETAAEYGDEQVFVWRRSYAVAPPALTPDDERNPANDPRYSSIPKEELPLTESLKDTVARVKPYWENEICPQIKSGKIILIVAHGNSLRALVKILDNVSDDEISQVNIPTASPLVYELDDNLKPIRHYYLGDKDEIEAAMEAVAKQGTAKN